MDNFKTYTNSLFGIAFNYPANWNIMDAQEMHAQLKYIQTKNKSFDEQVYEKAKKPLLILSRYHIDHPDINPTFKISINLYNNLKSIPLPEILAFLLEQMKQIFRNCRIRVHPKETMLDHKVAYYGQMYYTLQTTLDVENELHTEMWVIDRGRYFMMFTVSSKRDDYVVIKEDIKQMISSIKIHG